MLRILSAALAGCCAMVADGLEALHAARKAALRRLECDGELGGVEAKLVDVWRQYESEGMVLRRASAGDCAMSGGATASRFTMMSSSGDKICNSRVANPELGLVRERRDGLVRERRDDFQVEHFPVEGGLPSAEGSRTVGTAWPDTCTSASPCPMVVFLHGSGEFGYDTGQLTHWGLLNYYASDEACRRSLGSVIVMPQIEEGENWAIHGPAIFQHFVMPLVKGMLRANDNLDAGRVAIAGYSQGAVGAILGAALYPHTFSVLAAGSPAMPLADWKASKANFELPPVTVGKPRLQQIALSYSDDDIFDIKLSLRTLMGMMQGNGLLDEASVHIQLYRGIPHMAASEALFNHWGSLHELLWLGRFDTKLV